MMNARARMVSNRDRRPSALPNVKLSSVSSVKRSRRTGLRLDKTGTAAASLVLHEVSGSMRASRAGIFGKVDGKEVERWAYAVS